MYIFYVHRNSLSSSIAGVFIDVRVSGVNGVCNVVGVSTVVGNVNKSSIKCEKIVRTVKKSWVGLKVQD